MYQICKALKAETEDNIINMVSNIIRGSKMFRIYVFTSESITNETDNISTVNTQEGTQKLARTYLSVLDLSLQILMNSVVHLPYSSN